MITSLVVAATEDDIIGAGGALPWHIPGDLRRFRALTTGHVVVMGRVTHESILARLGHPLPGRTSVVVTRGPRAALGGGVKAAESLERALADAAGQASQAGCDEFFVIGGATVYAEVLPWVDRVYLTRIYHRFDGDRRMPAGWLDDFELVSREDAAEPTTGIRYSFLDWQRA
ncbi:MAG: dihydrofolate reductase [Nocardiopsaceae bacterium]|nr:dihydrofolate reductase [Nocardiopsaceae bacterium]